MAEVSAPQAQTPPPAASSLLLIDDDARNIRLLAEMLRHEGYRLFAALGGREGFDRAMQSPPALVLLDLHMPGMDGRQTCRLFKATPRLAGIPIIFLTGSGLLDDKLLAFAEGAVDYITKPFSADEVLARLRVHLRLARNGRQAVTAPEASAAQPADGPPIAGDSSNAMAADERLLRKAQAYLLRDLSASPMLGDLAHALGTNERSLTEAFRRYTGLAVYEYLRQERFRAACELLLHSVMPLGQIGELVGFKTPAAFSFAFRSQSGLTPRDFRMSGGLGSDPQDKGA